MGERFVAPIIRRFAMHHPKGRFRCNSGQAVIDACVSGLDICPLPHFYVLPYLDHGMVTLILEKFQPENETIWAVYPPVAEVLQRLGVGQHSLYAWKRQLGKQVSGDAGKDAEIRQLKRELARVTEERDILKKATAYFARDAK